MMQDKITLYFNLLNNSAQLLVADMDMTHTDALIEIMEDFSQQKVRQENGQPSADVVKKIEMAMTEVDWQHISTIDLRKAVQLAVLNANREDQLPANYQITPDGIGYLLADLIDKTGFVDNAKIADMTVGSGNLLWTVKNLLQKNKKSATFIGLDGDETQLALASATNMLLRDETIDLYQTDIVDTKEKISADVVIGDLPIGYYPLSGHNDLIMSQIDDRPFVHELMIERSLDLVSAQGWIYLIVPANIFNTGHTKPLLKMLASKAQLKAFLRLPLEFFKTKDMQKAILVLRPKGISAKGEVLMGQYPALKDIKTLQDFLQEIDAWVKLDKELNQ